MNSSLKQNTFVGRYQRETDGGRSDGRGLKRSINPSFKVSFSPSFVNARQT